MSEGTLYGPRELKSGSSAAQKLVTDGAARTQLFGLAADPQEKLDLAPENAARVQELKEFLRARAERTLRASAAAGFSAAFDRDHRAELEQLGYPGGAPK